MKKEKLKEDFCIWQDITDLEICRKQGAFVDTYLTSCGGRVSGKQEDLRCPFCGKTIKYED